MKQIKNEQDLVGKTVVRIGYTPWGYMVLFFSDESFALFITNISENCRLFDRSCSLIDFTISEDWK